MDFNFGMNYTDDSSITDFNFGMDLPDTSSIDHSDKSVNTQYNAIVDMSQWNPLNKEQFHELKENGIEAIIHRATNGETMKDQKYSTHKSLAESEGLLWGAYHVGTNGPVEDQVSNFLSAVGDDANNVIFSLNLLHTGSGSTDMTLPQAKEFLHQIHSKTGHTPLVYGSYYHLNSLIGDDKSIPQEGHCLWMADFKEGTAPRLPNAWDQWKIWHYTDGERGSEPHKVINGINLDRDIFHGTKDELKEFWKNTSSKC